MHLIPNLLRARLAGEHGFAMVAVISVMMVASLAAVAAVYATDSDQPFSARDRITKQAYAAAEAGVNDYLARLVADVDYWRQCNDPTNPSLSGDQNRTGAGARKWVPVKGSNASYSVEILGANNKAQCITSDLPGSVVDATTGTLRIRATGRVAEDGPKRSVVTTFKRKGFLDYVYFTDLETLDPQWYKVDSGGLPTNPDVVTWAQDKVNGCSKYFRDDRKAVRYPDTGQRLENGTWVDWDGPEDSPDTPDCGEINFVTGDNQNGPFHTNDEILVCGSPKFGRYPSDDIEVSAPPPPPATTAGSDAGWRACTGNSGSRPGVNDPGQTAGDRGTWRKSAEILEIPPSNAEMKTEALPNYRFHGRTTIELNGTNMTVTTRRSPGGPVRTQTAQIPNNGVIWVSNDTSGSCAGYNTLLAEHAPETGCGDVWVKGNYSRSVTIGTENDIVVEGNIARNNEDAMLGLVADNWVRVHHKTQSASGSGYCNAATGNPTNVSIDAAILAVNDSFTVDRYYCGGSLGTLTVRGAIAQNYRGPVGTGSGSTGYIKNYNYDERLRFRSPPHFLDPVKAAWKVQSQVEQVPAT